LARLLAGVGQLPPGWVASAHQISVAGLTRIYLTIEPSHISTSIPVVVLLHGRDMSPDGVLHISDLANRIGPALLVVPAGWGEFWNAGDCCGAAYLHHIDDVAFIHAALDAVVAAVPTVASSPVYAVGFSNGGRLAYHLACDLPGVFTGVMAVEAVPVEACPSMRPLDVTVVAQQADPLLTVNAGGRPKAIGGFIEPTVAATISHLAALDHCRTTPVAAVMGAAMERSWSCGSGSQLRYVWYPGGSHSWRPPTGATPGATDFVRQLLGRSDPNRPGPRVCNGPSRPTAALRGNAGVGR
jgi:polyhydroxybutyrate depolymerase